MLKPNGQFNKAVRYYKNRQYDEAIQLLESLHLQYGINLGQNRYYEVLTYLGKCNTESIHGSHRKAVEYLSAAALMGFAPAQYSLAKFYDEQYHRGNSSLFSCDIQDGAWYWFRESAISGYAPSEYRTGHLHALNNDYDEALKWYSLSAKRNYPPALWTLGWLNENGDKLKKNEKKAFKFYTRSALRGYAQSQVDLIRCFDEGIGVKKDKRKSSYWRSKALTKKTWNPAFKFSEMDVGDLIKDLTVDDENNDETIMLNVCMCHRYIQCGFGDNGEYYMDEFCSRKCSGVPKKCFMNKALAPDPNEIKIKAEITGYKDWFYL